MITLYKINAEKGTKKVILKKTGDTLPFASKK